MHMWISRDIEPRLRRSARTRPVVVLTGARQTGKTSTLLRLFPKLGFVSLDLPTEAEQAEKEPQNFLRRHPSPTIIDEVQYAPGLFRHLKVAVDASRARNGQFLLTGSQKFTLMRSVSESLAGRADIVELETLSWAEMRAALPQTRLEAAIVRGGFPELEANPDIDHVAFYNSYLATYLERDVRALANVGNLRDFERFLRACALRSANLLNKADLARDVGIAPSTANLWLSTLEASGQVVLLEPWFSNRTKSIVKSPKLYLADTGLLCALLNIRSEEVLSQSPAAGAVWETFVFAQLRARPGPATSGDPERHRAEPDHLRGHARDRGPPSHPPRSRRAAAGTGTSVTTQPAETAPSSKGPGPWRSLERAAILDALQRTHGHKTLAAGLLGLTRFQLHTRLKRYGIEVSPDWKASFRKTL